jgi:hypothetical protein
MGIVFTTFALFAAVLLGSPAIRAVFGPPVGWHEDFTSDEARYQVLATQLAFLSVAFLVLGAFSGSNWEESLRLSFLAANPLTIGIGYASFMLLYKALNLDVWEYAYYDVRNGLVLILFGMAVFVPCFRAGARISQR